MVSEVHTESDIPADTVYIRTTPAHKVSHNTRVEWFIGNINRSFIFPSPGAAAEFPDWPIHSSPADWSSLSVIAASPVPQDAVLNFPLTFRIQPNTTVKYLAHSYRITFVLDLSDSMLQPTPSGLSVLHHAVAAIETTLYKLIPPTSSLPLPLPGAHLTPFSIFISIIGVVPNRHSFTLIHDWEGSYNDIKTVITTMAQRLFQLETDNLLTSHETNSRDSALVDVLRHGVLTLAMQMPEWAPASLIIVSDACFTTLDMVELDCSLAHLRASSIRCSFIIPSACSETTAFDLSPNGSLRNLLKVISSSPCIPHVDLCQFIAHATAGFCLTGLSPEWEMLKDQSSTQWNQIHELLLSLRLQDDITSTPEREGELGWLPIHEIQPYCRVVNAALNHVLASRLKDGYRLRGVSKPLPSKTNQNPSTSSEFIQIELALAWKPGVIFRLFLAGEWYFPTGQLPLSSSSDYLPKCQFRKPVCGRYCIANFRVRANCSLLRVFTEQRRDHITSPYLVSTLERFDFHFRLLKHVDNYIETVSSFNLNADIYTVPTRYLNGLCSVFITAQNASGGTEIYLSGNMAEEIERDKSLSAFVHYWGQLLSLDIANCYRWMHSETIYVVLEHDSPLPSNLFIPLQTRRVTETITCRQSLARIHSMLTEWCTFVLLENHTYIRLEYPRAERFDDPSKPGDIVLALHHPASQSTPRYFTLVRLEMKLPEVRVRVAFTAGVPYEYRRATIDQLSQQFKFLSFLPRGRQAVPKSRHKSGTPAPLHPPIEGVHVPPLQRSWGETPCCLVFESQLDRLIVETGTWAATRPHKFLNSSLSTSTNFRTSKSFLKGTITEARCEVSPSLLRQHLCNSSCIWVIPLVSKSPNCLTKMFSTLKNLRIQEGFHFVRSGPQPGFVSLAREIMFSVDSAAEGAIKQPCLIQYQLYPFRLMSNWSDLSNEDDYETIKIASDAVRKVLDSKVDDCAPRMLVNRLRGFTSAQISSEIHIVTEVWIEPKHGHSTDLPTEALYMASLPYNEVVQRIMQLDCFCLAAYTTLEKMLTACLLKMIELQRLATPTSVNEVPKPSVQFAAPPVSCSSMSSPAAGVPFNLAAVTSVSPRMCLLYPLLLDTSLVPNTKDASSYLSSENVISRLVFNLTQRTPYITAISLSEEDCDQFNQFLISEEPEEVRPSLKRALAESGPVKWQCFATITSIIDSISRNGSSKPGNKGENGSLQGLPHFENLVEASNNEITSSPVTFFVLPTNMECATSSFCQNLLTNLRQRLNGSSRPETSFAIFLFSCTHTYLSFPLDDRWTYGYPGTLVVDFFRQEPKVQPEGEISTRLIHADELTASPPQSFLSAAKGNPQLTKELILLWARLRDASLGLLNLCNEAFVECAHRALLHGFVVSEAALKSVLMSDQFCSSLTPISVDATDFLFSTCSHCFTAMRNSRNSTGSFTSDCSKSEKKKSPSVCEIRPHDTDRIRNRIASVFSQYFSPIPQFPGFYYFRGAEETYQVCHGQNLLPAQRCDTWPIPIAKTSSLEVSAQNPVTLRQKFSEIGGSRQVLFCNSSRSGSDTEEVRKRQNSGTSCVREEILGPIEPEHMEKLQVIYKQPLFMKIMMTLKYGNIEEIILPIESLPICLPNVIPTCEEISREKVCLSVVFVPLLWKPEVGALYSETSIESPDLQELQPPGHLDRLEEKNEFLHSSDSSDKEEMSTTGRVADENFSIIRPLASPQISISRRNIPVLSNTSEDCVIVPFHWCECQLEVSESDTPCCICRTTCTAEFIHYLDNEQWTSIQHTVQVFRWLLQDEVVCSQRIVQPITVSTVETVLQHMETTKCLLLNSDPGISTHSPFHINHSHARFSKSCTTVIEKSAFLKVSDILQSLMSAIAWETVDLKFISQSEKSIPRFLQLLQSMSFRYAQARLVDTGEYYVVCRAEPIPPHPSASKETGHAEESEKEEASASPNVRTRRYGVVKETEETSAHSPPLTASPQSVPAMENISEDSGGFGSVTSRTHRSSTNSLEHRQNLAASTTSTDGEFEDSRFLLSSHFPPQDALETSNSLRQPEGPSPPAYWLVFRVGNGSIQAFFHHSDSHRVTSTVADSCPHCVVFRRALGDIESIVRLVNQSLLLDQLLLDRICHPALLPEPEEPPRHPPRHLQAALPPSWKRSGQHLTRSPSLVVSASSATDSENTDGQSVDNSSRKKSTFLSGEYTGIPIESCSPGSLACPSKFSFSLDVSPRAVIAGDRGNQVLPELRRHLENFAVLNRKNMFVFDYVDPNSSDSSKLLAKKNLMPRIFYIILRELPAFETSGHGDGHPYRRDSLPFPLTANRIQLQVTLHGISSPSRQFCTFVKSLLQSLLDKIILEYLQQALSRTVLFRFASHDFDFLFIRRTHVTHQQLYFTLPKFLLDDSTIPHIPKGSLVLPFCQYLKQNLLTCMTAAKPEKEVLPSLRSRFGCGEVMLYHRRRSVGTAKFGLVTALVDLLQGDSHEPYCITSCLDLQEWLCRRRVNEDLSALVSVEELTKFLKDIELSQDVCTKSPDRLLVRLRLWIREEVDLKLLTQRLISAMRNALFDLLIEYTVLSLPACTIEVPVLKSRFSEPSPNSAVRSGPQIFTNDLIRLPNLVSLSLLPWFEIAASLQLPLVVERRLQLASLQSVELLVGELVTQLNSLIELRVGLPLNHLKCPLHSTLGSTSTKPDDGRPKSANFQPHQGSSSTTCPCQQCINFFAFVADKNEWTNFSKAQSFNQRDITFAKRREFLIVGKNYATCRYQSALNMSSSGGFNVSTISTNEDDKHVFVKYVASWSVRSPLQRHQSLEINVQQSPDETALESSAISEEAAVDQTPNPIASPNTPIDIPEFCEMQLRLPKFLFHQRRSSIVTSIEESTEARSSQQSQPTVCLQVPRQTLCLIHIQGRDVRINLYNWSRDDADRLLHRIDSLVQWYNQRYQLLGCLSLQKTGLFHCLRTPSHLQLLKQANQLSNNLAPPELSSAASSIPVPIQTVPVTATASSMSIRRRFLEGLVGSGAAPLQQQLPGDTPSATTMATQNVTTSPAILTSPATPIGEMALPSGQYMSSHLKKQEHLRVIGGSSKESKDFNLTRIYQNCARVPDLGRMASSTPVEFMDVVHLHVDQALCAVKNDCTQAEKLRLITAPLKVWMAGDIFDVDHYNSSTQTDDVSKPHLTPATVFFTAVKKYSRTLHTVCSPILFCPRTRVSALKLRELEQIAEDVGYKRFGKHVGPEQNDIAKEEPRYSSTPITKGEDLPRRIEEQQQLSARRRTPSTVLSSVPAVTSRENPPWMQEATDCLLQEFITYMTKQMQFSVIYSTLDSDDDNKVELPYALLQRSVKMAGIHLIEVFVRSSLFCVRLKAVELCRLTRAATRAILTGPLAADFFGRAAAVAAVKITSGIVDPIPINPPSSSSTSSSAFLSSPYIIKWEESSRLCDCVHLHSFLYDFYLRNVDSFLKLQSDLIGQRMQVPALAWALPQATKTITRRSAFYFGGSSAGSMFSGTGGSFSVARHPFLPANFSVVAFLRDLAQIVPQAPVFARGTFVHIPMCLTSDTRIKPEQIFEHLIDSRQIYGFKAFDLGINSSLPTHARFGFCTFTSPKSSTCTEGERQTSQRKHLPGMGHHQSDCDVEEEEDNESSCEPSPLLSVDSQAATPTNTTDKIDLLEEQDVVVTADDHTSTEISSPLTAKNQRKQPPGARVGDQLRLPSLKHFALACAAYLDKEASAAKKRSSTASQGSRSGGSAGGEEAHNKIVISVFAILTDQYRRFPRPRLSSLPQAADDRAVPKVNYRSPVQWPAVRPGFTSESDMSMHSPKLVRSGSHETTQGITAEPSSGYVAPMTTGQRYRHTSLNIRTLGDMTTTADRSSSNESTVLQRHPGPRYKVSYLGVLPSHQMDLQQALKTVHQALYACMPRIINSAILSCHKNLLWYRLFDSQYFPTTHTSDYREGVEEIGQEAVSLLGPEFVHRGLSCDEFEDLISSAPLKLDLLRMDPRLVDLLRISGKYLATSVINHLNASGGKTVAFIFPETSDGWSHLVIIDPTFREGLIQTSWRKESSRNVDRGQVLISPQPIEVGGVQSSSVKSRLSSMLRSILSSVNRTVEGIPMGEPPEESWDSCEFTMMAVFRSTGSMEASMRNFWNPSITPAPSSNVPPPLSTLSIASNIYRTHLMPALKLLVEILTLHVWNDLH